MSDPLAEDMQAMADSDVNNANCSCPEPCDCPVGRKIAKMRRDIQESNLESAGPLTVLLHSWLTPLVMFGAKHPLTVDDIADFPPEYSIDQVQKGMHREWATQRDAHNAYATQVQQHRADVRIAEEALVRGQTVRQPSEHTYKPTDAPSILYTIARANISMFILCALCEFGFYAISFAQPYLIRAITTFFKDAEDGKDPPAWHGVLYALGLAAVALISATVMMGKLYHATLIATKLRSGMVQAIYEKSLRVAAWSLKDTTSGAVMNLMSNDAQKPIEATVFMNSVWSSPLTITVCLILMIIELGVSALAAMGMLFLLFPYQLGMAALIRANRVRTVRLTDTRVKLVNEVLQGVRVVKLYAWEDAVCKVLAEVRRKELFYIRLGLLMKAVNQALIFVWPSIVTFVTMVIYARVEGDLSEEKVFLMLSFLNVARFPITLLPQCLQTLVEMLVAAKRVSAYLNKEELPPRPYLPAAALRGKGFIKAYDMTKSATEQGASANVGVGVGTSTRTGKRPGSSSPRSRRNSLAGLPLYDKVTGEGMHPPTDPVYTGDGTIELASLAPSPASLPYTSTLIPASARGLAISINHCHFYWTSSVPANSPDGTTPVPPVLADVSLHVPAGALVGVVGPVGAGKSSLLCSILGEMHSCAVRRGSGSGSGDGSRVDTLPLRRSDENSAPGEFSYTDNATPISLSTLCVRGRVGYFPQDPWLLNATVRDNITLGLPFDEEKFDRVLRGAALLSDLAIFAEGADTMIGESGVNMSGGQKARIALARVLYRADELDTVLLDDPFAAVDMGVGKTMFYQGVVETLQKQGKTVILALNSHLHFLRECDQIIGLGLCPPEKLREVGIVVPGYNDNLGNAEIPKHNNDDVIFAVDGVDSDVNASSSQRPTRKSDGAGTGAGLEAGEGSTRVPTTVLHVGDFATMVKLGYPLAHEGEGEVGDEAKPEDEVAPGGEVVGEMGEMRGEDNVEVESGRVVERGPARVAGDAGEAMVDRAGEEGEAGASMGAEEGVMRTSASPVVSPVEAGERRREVTKDAKSGRYDKHSQKDPFMTSSSVALTVTQQRQLHRGESPFTSARTTRGPTPLLSSTPADMDPIVGRMLGDLQLPPSAAALSFTHSCAQCRGTGRVEEGTCTACEGTGEISEPLRDGKEGEEAGSRAYSYALELSAAVRDKQRRKSSAASRTAAEEEEEEEYGLAVIPRPTRAVPVRLGAAGEAIATGDLKMSTYGAYFRGSGGTGLLVWRLFSLAVIAVAAQLARLLIDYWILLWANDSPYDPKTSDHTETWWIDSSGIIVGVAVFLLGVRTLTLLLINIDAAQYLHDSTLARVLAAPMSWFDTTPLGQIMNRFSKDMDVVDGALPDNLLAFVQQSLQLLGIVGLAIASTYYFVLPLIPLAGLLYYFQYLFRRAATQIKRVELATFSPVYASFSAAARGASSVRAFKLQDQFLFTHRCLVDVNAKAVAVYNLVQRWLSFRLDALAAVYVFCVGVIAVIVRNDISASITGLAITNAMQLTGLLQNNVRVHIILEGCLTSVERLIEYQETPQEPAYRSPVPVLASLEHKAEPYIKENVTAERKLVCISEGRIDCAHAAAGAVEEDQEMMLPSREASHHAVAVTTPQQQVTTTSTPTPITDTSTGTGAGAVPTAAASPALSPALSSASLANIVELSRASNTAAGRRVFGWPWRGAISLHHVTMSYRPELPIVLNDLSVEIPAGKKVGIVGRTGSGKSSLLLVLFRMVELHSGNVFIDGVDTATIGLGDLRSRVSIIPQQPVMFSGTVRYNLDPFSQHTEEEIELALRQVNMWDSISTLPGGIDAIVAEFGSNFSQGQRQLLCIARALLRASPIIVLDEATAAIDLATDALIQSSIRTSFRHCTILTIAHRLDTVVDYDYILVLNPVRPVTDAQGNSTLCSSLCEFAHPYELLSDPTSEFYKMASQAGPAGFAQLLARAKTAWESQV